MKTLFALLAVLAVLAAVYCLPNPPSYPIKEICSAYGEKCVKKFNRRDCPARTIECQKYANQGIKTTWNFCMFSNNYDVAACNQRSQIDFQIIQSWISKDQFEYLPE